MTIREAKSGSSMRESASSTTAAAYDPGPHMYQLYYERRYDELIDLAQDIVLEHHDDLSAQYMLGIRL